MKVFLSYNDIYLEVVSHEWQTMFVSKMTLKSKMADFKTDFFQTLLDRLTRYISKRKPKFIVLIGIETR